MAEQDVREEVDPPAPRDGALVATLEWVVAHVDEHIVEVGSRNDAAVMGAAWALGFAGATREQVWWALRDGRLRAAFVSLCHALARIRATEVPAWLEPVTHLAPADRAALALHVEAMRDGTGAKIRADDAPLFGVVIGDPRTLMAPDRSFAAVPTALLDELLEVARSVTDADVARLLDRARSPFQRRLDEAAQIASEGRLAFHARRPRSAA
jgi:hypothetical protein